MIDNIMNYALTAVSGYWIVKNKHDNEYTKWFKNSLYINCPYVFFGNKESIEIIKPFREHFPTVYIECEIDEFYTYKYKNVFKIDTHHCPSRELNLIWHEKIFLIEKAIQLNPFHSDFFQWIDAGICEYRTEKPPTYSYPELNKLSALPTDKFIFTSSENSHFEPHLMNTYYHYISGTSYMFHKKMIDIIVHLYKEKLEILLPRPQLYTDQMILTHIYYEHPEMFCHFGHYYGKLVSLLY
jgi:hypothetical protein